MIKEESLIDHQAMAVALLKNVAVIFKEIKFDYQACNVKGNFSATWAARLPAILLSIGKVEPNDKNLHVVVSECTSDTFRSSKETIGFFNDHWSAFVTIGRNSKEKVTAGNYDDFRDHGIIALCNNGLVVRNTSVKNKNLNGKDTAYGLTPEGLRLLKQFGTNGWEEALKDFQNTPARINITKNLIVRPVNDAAFVLNNDPHNFLQQQIIERMLTKFAPNYKLIYTGDTADRERFYQPDLAKILNINKLFEEKIPDVVAWYPEKNWIFVVEAVTSTGHIDKMKKETFERFLGQRKHTTIFVTAFLDRATFKKFAHDIAWETEVWIADDPDHMVHFNGHKFLGPFSEQD